MAKDITAMNEVAKKKKDFMQWLTEDALPTTSEILSELKKLNKEADERKEADAKEITFKKDTNG